VGEILVVLAVLGLMLGGVLTTMRRLPITTFAGLRNLDELPFAGAPLIVLALLAAGDGAAIFERIGSPAVIAVLLGIVAGLLGARAAFPVLGALAVAAGFVSLFSGSFAQTLLAVLVLVPLVVGIVVGMFPFGELRPTVLIAKACMAVVFAQFAVSPLGGAVIAPDIPFDLARSVVTVVVACLAALLFVLPGAGVSALLGIGVGLLDVYVGGRDEDPVSLFTVAFLMAWVVTSGLRLMFRRRR
jgi:hypothetical protein